MHVKEGEGNNWMHSSKFTMSHVLIRLRCIISQVKSYLISLPDMGSLFFQGCAAGTAAALKKKRDRLSSDPWAKQELWFLLGFGSWKQLLRSWEGWGAATLQSKMRHLLLVQVMWTGAGAGRRAGARLLGMDMDWTPTRARACCQEQLQPQAQHPLERQDEPLLSHPQPHSACSSMAPAAALPSCRSWSEPRCLLCHPKCWYGVA